MVLETMTRQEIIADIEADKKYIQKEIKKTNNIVSKMPIVRNKIASHFTMISSPRRNTYSICSMKTDTGEIRSMYILHLNTSKGKEYILYRNINIPTIIRYTPHAAKRIRERFADKILDDNNSTGFAVLASLNPQNIWVATIANEPDFLKSFKDIFLYKNTYIAVNKTGYYFMDISPGNIVVRTFFDESMVNSTSNRERFAIIGGIHDYLNYIRVNKKPFCISEIEPNVKFKNMAFLVGSCLYLPISPYCKHQVIVDDHIFITTDKNIM